MQNSIKEFLYQSNLIENETSDEALEDAREAWNYCIGQSVLTHEVIQKTHKILMHTRDLKNIYKGVYRCIPVYIGCREGYKPNEISGALTYWLEENTRKVMNFNYIKHLHIMYERIHPFLDGNGRTGRIFMNYQRVKNGFELEIINYQDRQEYYKWFSK